MNSRNLSSHLLKNLKAVKCQKTVLKKLPNCEHSKQIPCFKDPASAVCTESCDQRMGCCSKKCKGSCGNCQKQNSGTNQVQSGLIKRINHIVHPCERVLYCQHLCGLPCHPKDQGCNSECKQPCRQRCNHHKCPGYCSVTCTPCLEVCPWKCAHHECPVPCGSVSRLDVLSQLQCLLSNIFRSAPDFHVMSLVLRRLSVVILVHLVGHFYSVLTPR